MNTAKKFFAIALWLAVCLPLSAEQPAQPIQSGQSDTATSCQQWFFHYPQSEQKGALLEISHETLTNPRNLLAGKQDWLQLVEVPAFRENFYGKRVAGLTLFYDPCRGIPSLAVYNTAEELASVDTAVAQAKADQQPASDAIAPAVAVSGSVAESKCDPEISWTTLYHGKSGKEVPFSKLVKDKKLTGEEAARIRGSETFLNVSEAYGSEFSIRKNGCNNSFRVTPTLVTSRVVSDSVPASGEKTGTSKIRALSYLGGTGAATYFAIAGSTVGMIAAGPVAMAVPLLIDLIRSRRNKTPKQDAAAGQDPKVTSKVTYKTAATQPSEPKLSQPKPTRKYSDPCKVKVGDGVWHKFGECSISGSSKPMKSTASTYQGELRRRY